MSPSGSRISFVSTSAGGYEVRLDGRLIGHVGRVGRTWTGRVGEFEIGEHPTRQAAVAAMIDVDRQ